MIDCRHAMGLNDIPFDTFGAPQLSDLSLSARILLGALLLASYAGIWDAASWIHQPLRHPDDRTLVRRAGTREAFRWARRYCWLALVFWWFGY